MQSDKATINDQLESLLAAGRQMLAEAQNGDWDRAGESQARCHSLAEALFTEPVTATDAPAVAAAVSEVMELHQAAIALCKTSRDASMQDIDSLKQGRQAVNEYSANSG